MRMIADFLIEFMREKSETHFLEKCNNYRMMVSRPSSGFNRGTKPSMQEGGFEPPKALSHRLLRAARLTASLLLRILSTIARATHKNTGISPVHA